MGRRALRRAGVGYARLIRGAATVTKRREDVVAAQAIGADDAGIVERLLLPNAMSPAQVHAAPDLVLYLVLAVALRPGRHG